MKLMKRTPIYKASNVVFNHENIEATSYDWWVFVKRIGKRVVFNSYRYSVSTAKHQRKVRTLMRELGIRVDIEVSFRESLSEVTQVHQLKRLQARQDAHDLELAETKRLERNRKRRARRALKRERETYSSGVEEAGARGGSFSSGVDGGGTDQAWARNFKLLKGGRLW